MATTCYVIHKDGGEIVGCQYGDSDAPPTPGTGETVIDAGVIALPDPKTHKVVSGAVVAKTQGEQDAERDAARKKELEVQIATATACKKEMDAHVPAFDTTEIAQEIANMEAEWSSLP